MGMTLFMLFTVVDVFSYHMRQEVSQYFFHLRQVEKHIQWVILDNDPMGHGAYTILLCLV